MPQVSILDNLISKESGVIRKTAINAKRDPFCWLDNFWFIIICIEKWITYGTLFTSADLGRIAGRYKKPAK